MEVDRLCPLHASLGSMQLVARSLLDSQEGALGWVTLGVREALTNGMGRCAHLCWAGDGGVAEVGVPAGVSQRVLTHLRGLDFPLRGMCPKAPEHSVSEPRPARGLGNGLRTAKPTRAPALAHRDRHREARHMASTSPPCSLAPQNLPAPGSPTGKEGLGCVAGGFSGDWGPRRRGRV